MTEKLEKSGCIFNKNNIRCVECDEDRSGGFDPSVGVELCHNKSFEKVIMEDTIAHELIHAYDHCNFNVNWFNLEHHACSEIRAASLSGDCRFSRELARGNFGFIKHHQKCVKRRAIISIQSNPACKSKKEAKEAVNKVFDSCFNDTEPFDEIY
ncbi:Mitochondrial inner membrane protease ATP23 [Zancudomyces culisetae]|uniref:Mitochondrial inner membrane protease ATP23 n=1 Tax=Zancudomyces culisetae TaxID=1213189 RepID=A0A1R1PUA8_ZANCU|nr:Mitochondrial inner membrane protease ATP23 [Zancudomyces culisetae]|eukprot:OMH84544.1 Mitochondrial inner membrane protease ATP23 [Zancudomyces culisetae]